MFDFDRFDQEPVAIAPGVSLGQGVRLVFDPDAAMTCVIRRSERHLNARQSVPTLVVSGRDRAPDDWLGLEIDLPHAGTDVAITGRNYPVHRLFPRLHYELQGRVSHLDLPDVAASDSFATRVFPARSWGDTHDLAKAEAIRLTVLIPSTPWFAMELQAIAVGEPVHA